MAKKTAKKTVKRKTPKTKAKATASNTRARRAASSPAAKAKKSTRRASARATAKPKKVTRAPAAKKKKRPVSAQAAAKRPAKSAARPRAARRKVASTAAVAPARPRGTPSGRAAGTPSGRKLAPKDLDQFRQMLLEKRAEILGDVSTLHNEALNRNRQEASGDLSSMPIHMADLGTDNYELEFTLGLIEGERAILREIDEALERLRDDTYGFCLATNQPIGKARLRAKPWAKYCYEYTLAQEQGHEPGL